MDEFLYEFIRQNGGWNNWKIEIIYECHNKTKEECLSLETKYINDCIATLNSAKFDKNKYFKEWYALKRDEIKKEKLRQKEIIAEYYKSLYDISKNPEWYLNNVKYSQLKIN